LTERDRHLLRMSLDLLAALCLAGMLIVSVAMMLGLGRL
jgi:hypothetical protein